VSTIAFRPTEAERRIIRECGHAGETTSDVLRRALRLLEQDAWLERFRAEAEGYKDEDLSGEPQAW
jgi:antitoxin ParD1/3/4